MEGYRLFRKDRPGRRGGGVAIYVRDRLESMELCLGTGDQLTESLWGQGQRENSNRGHYCGDLLQTA